MIRPVILSGGSGTRLWPLSTSSIPKQLAPLLGEETLFSRTMRRLHGAAGVEEALVVTGQVHSRLVAEELERTGVPTAHILVEPEGRNTAPAVTAAALVSAPEEVLVVLPSDHLVADVDEFRAAVARAAGHAASGSIVTFGVTPSRVETGYGYLQVGELRGEVHALAGFTEKPGEAEAEELVKGGRHLWNSGMFVLTAHTLLTEMERHRPDVLERVRAALPESLGDLIALGDEFREAPSISFDHAVMERTDLGVVMPVDFGWSDIGSYRSLLEAGERDEAGNRVVGEVVLSDVTDSYLHATSRRVVVAGVSGLVVVETPEAVLVIPLDRDQEVRELHDRASRR